MATSRIYVSGTRLYWQNRTGTITYSIQGVRPTNASLFSGQPSGKIWVATDADDLALYYSDELGATRFIAGVRLGDSSALSGTVTTRGFLCPDDVLGDYAPDIYWVTERAGGARALMQARAEGIPDMRFVAVNAEVTQLNGTNMFEYRVWTNGYVPLLESMSFATSSLAPYYIQFYSDNLCATPLTDNDGETRWAQLPYGVGNVYTNNVMTIPGPPLQRGTDPATPWFTTQSMAINSTTIDGKPIGSMKIVFPTMSIFADNNLSRVGERASGSVFCNGPDLIQLNTILKIGGESCLQLTENVTTSTTTVIDLTTQSPICECRGVDPDFFCSKVCPGAGAPCTPGLSGNCYDLPPAT